MILFQSRGPRLAVAAGQTPSGGERLTAEGPGLKVALLAGRQDKIKGWLTSLDGRRAWAEPGLAGAEFLAGPQLTETA